MGGKLSAGWEAQLSSGSRSVSQGFAVRRRWVFMGSAVPEQPRSPGTVAADVPARTTFGPDWNSGSFRDLLESAPDAMVIVDSSWEIVLVNAEAEKLFGYRREELLGRCVEMLVAERFREGHSGYRAAYSADPHTLAMGTGVKLCGQRKDGTEFPVEISLGPIET